MLRTKGTAFKTEVYKADPTVTFVNCEVCGAHWFAPTANSGGFKAGVNHMAEEHNIGKGI